VAAEGGDTHLIRQIAERLNIDPDYLLMLGSKQLPSDIAQKAAAVDQDTYAKALILFREALDRAI